MKVRRLSPVSPPHINKRTSINIINMIGKKTITEVLPELQAMAKEHGLRINRVKDFKIIRKILAIRYFYFND